MKAVYKDIDMTALTGNLREDVYNFLVDNKCPNTAAHCLRVGDESKRIAELYGLDPVAAEYAGYLHDISAVYPNNQRIRIAGELGIEILAEEEAFPLIIHQKISRVMARDLFGITSEEVLDAVGCHTTLRSAATELDKVLFVADKIEWDQPGSPPYLDEIKTALERSLDHASYAYINYLWQQRESLKVVHPWLEAAYYELKAQLAIAQGLRPIFDKQFSDDSI